MNVQEFVKETIEQVTRGVFDAQHSCEGFARVGATRLYSRKRRSLSDLAQGRETPKSMQPAKVAPSPGEIEFDIAVAVTNSSESGGKASIAVMGIGIGGAKQKEAVTSTTHRIKFVVPVVFLPSTI